MSLTINSESKKNVFLFEYASSKKINGVDKDKVTKEKIIFSINNSSIKRMHKLE